MHPKRCQYSPSLFSSLWLVPWWHHIRHLLSSLGWKVNVRGVVASSSFKSSSSTCLVSGGRSTSGAFEESVPGSFPPSSPFFSSPLASSERSVYWWQAFAFAQTFAFCHVLLLLGGGVRVGQTGTSNVKRSLLKILIICKVFKYQEFVYTNKKMWVGQTGNIKCWEYFWISWSFWS